MGSVLVLNATYEPLNVISVRRAVVLLLKDKAEILEATEQRIRSSSLSLPAPSVIRLVYYVRIPRPMHIPLSRHTIMLRDGFTCQYCGRTPHRSQLTIDHVIPKVRGGGSTWDNLVCACKRCNQIKGARTPREAGMTLRTQPGEPRYLAMVMYDQTKRPQAWYRYMSPRAAPSLSREVARGRPMPHR
ncbi:MAG: HNH endonuclease [Anaerolineae bacterium]|nr:HNH endonuclease [Anaerolineae bacterium]